MKNYSTRIDDDDIKEFNDNGAEDHNIFNDPALSVTHSEEATTHVDSDLLTKNLSNFLIPWIEKVVQDDKMFEYAK